MTTPSINNAPGRRQIVDPITHRVMRDPILPADRPERPTRRKQRLHLVDLLDVVARQPHAESPLAPAFVTEADILAVRDHLQVARMIVGADLVDVIDLEPLGNRSIEINPDKLVTLDT